MAITRSIVGTYSGLDVFGRPTGERSSWMQPAPIRKAGQEFTWAGNVPKQDQVDFREEYGDNVLFGPTSLSKEDSVGDSTGKWVGVFFREGAFGDHNRAFLKVYERCHRH